MSGYTVMQLSDIHCAIAKSECRWVLYLFVQDGDEERIRKAAPYLSPAEISDLAAGERLFLRFRKRKAALRAYDQTHGDSNDHPGSASVFACLCGPDGRIRGDNT